MVLALTFFCSCVCSWSQVIADHLVTFEDVRQMQERNRTLVQVTGIFYWLICFVFVRPLPAFAVGPSCFSERVGCLLVDGYVAATIMPFSVARNDLSIVVVLLHNAWRFIAEPRTYDASWDCLVMFVF